MRRRMLPALGWALGFLLLGGPWALARAAPAGDHGAHDEGEPLHFIHPLIAESPSPDTKLRLDHRFLDKDDGEAHTGRLEAEYAFARWISVEADFPYTFLDPEDAESRSRLDNVELGLKLASHAFERHGLILGGGLGLALPTGDDDEGIGSDNELEVAPFVGMGLETGRLQTVAFVEFAVPTNQEAEEADEVDLELGFNLSFLYRLTAQVSPLLELDGTTVAAGDDDRTVVNVTPALKIRPLANSDLVVGLGVSLPVTADEDFDVRTVLSLFYHF